NRSPASGPVPRADAVSVCIGAATALARSRVGERSCWLLARSKPLVIGQLPGGAEQVAFAAPRMDQPPWGSGIEFRAQPLDIHVDDVGKWIEIFVPNVLGDLLPADDTILVEDQKLQKRVLLGGQADRPPGAGHDVISRVHRKIANPDHRRAEDRGTP